MKFFMNKNNILFILVLNISFANTSNLYSSRHNAITKAIEKVSPAVVGINVTQIKQHAAHPFFDPFFSPRKLLELQAGLYGVKKKDRITDTILKLVSLENQANSYSRSLSGGMKRRLLVAKAMVHQPPIIILDEPTAGVDVDLRKTLWENLRLLNNRGVTIILTTHYLEEAEKMCDRIGILNNGELVALDTTENLLKRIQTKIVNFTLDKKINIEDNSLESLKIISNDENKLIVSYEKSKISIESLILKLKKQNIKILDISTDDGDLEDVFMRLTKN